MALFLCTHPQLPGCSLAWDAQCASLISHSDMGPGSMSLSPSPRKMGLSEKPLWKQPCLGPHGLLDTLILTFLQSHAYNISLITFIFRTDEMNSLEGGKYFLSSASGAISEYLQINLWNIGTAFIFMSNGHEK